MEVCNKAALMNVEGVLYSKAAMGVRGAAERCLKSGCGGIKNDIALFINRQGTGMRPCGTWDLTDSAYMYVRDIDCNHSDEHATMK